MNFKAPPEKEAPARRRVLVGMAGLSAAGCAALWGLSTGQAALAADDPPVGAAKGATTAEPKLDLSGFQLPSGLVQTFKNGDIADPYFPLYVFELARRAGFDVRDSTRSFVEWGLSAQLKAGNFTKQCKKGADWAACSRADSDDATLAKWIYLLTTEGTALGFDKSKVDDSIARADRFLMSLRMENGAYSVFPPGTAGYRGYALFKDNVEILSSFEKLAAFFKKTGQQSSADLMQSRAADLRKAIEFHFGKDPWRMKRLALGASYDKERFYPHAVAIPFGWAEGYYPAPTKEDWDAWLSKYQSAWDNNAQIDFPWGTIAMSAYFSNYANVAACWLKKYEPRQKTQERWNVLEETCAQILKVRLKESNSTCVS